MNCIINKVIDLCEFIENSIDRNFIDSIRYEARSLKKIDSCGTPWFYKIAIGDLSISYTSYSIEYHGPFLEVCDSDSTVLISYGDDLAMTGAAVGRAITYIQKYYKVNCSLHELLVEIKSQ